MAGTRRTGHKAPHRLILDSGAVIALTRGDQRVRAFLAQAVEAGGAQILTGDREDLERLASAHPEVWIHPL